MMGVIWKADSTLFWGLNKACFYLWLNTPGEGMVSNDPESPSVLERDSLKGGWFAPSSSIGASSCPSPQQSRPTESERWGRR